MLILDTVSKIKDGRIPIPLYHRGHLSLMSGTVVTACLIPRGSEASERLPEMVVSPIQFKSWRRVWRITVVFREQQGVVHKLLSIIREINFNVLFEESSSIESRGFHEIELIVDSSTGYPDFVSEEEDERRIFALERKIAALCINEIAMRKGRPRLKVRRMKSLFRAWTQCQSRLEDPTTPKRMRPIVERAPIEDGELILPGKVTKFFQPLQPIKPLLISDTKERLLRISFVGKNDCMTYARIFHLDSIGALDSITGVLVSCLINKFHLQGL